MGAYKCVSHNGTMRRVKEILKDDAKDEFLPYKVEFEDEIFPPIDWVRKFEDCGADGGMRYKVQNTRKEPENAKGKGKFPIIFQGGTEGKDLEVVPDVTAINAMYDVFSWVTPTRQHVLVHAWQASVDATRVRTAFVIPAEYLFTQDRPTSQEKEFLRDGQSVSAEALEEYLDSVVSTRGLTSEQATELK